MTCEAAPERMWPSPTQFPIPGVAYLIAIPLRFLGADDHVDLSGIDANGKASGNGLFQFTGTHAFAKTAGHCVYEKSASSSIVYGNINGDGKADFALQFDDSLNCTPTTLCFD